MLGGGEFIGEFLLNENRKDPWSCLSEVDGL